MKALEGAATATARGGGVSSGGWRDAQLKVVAKRKPTLVAFHAEPASTLDISARRASAQNVPATPSELTPMSGVRRGDEGAVPTRGELPLLKSR